MARQEMTDDFVIVNGDVVFTNKLLDGLIQHNHNICVAIHRKTCYDQEDMKVITIDEVVNRISKEIPLSDANGESIGMIKFANKANQILIDTLDKMVRNKEYINAFFPRALQKISDNGFQVHYFEASPEDSVEIDFHPDLDEVRASLEKFTSKISLWINR